MIKSVILNQWGKNDYTINDVRATGKSNGGNSLDLYLTLIPKWIQNGLKI